jgi:hypothetical protein
MEWNKEAYDCLSLYKHADKSYEWRACRVMRRELLLNYKEQLNQDSGESDAMSFSYWIEFWHARDEGSHMWFKRNYSEILLSTDYTRY